MIEDLGYRPYYPSGYTDDLGIIADRNQWVPAQLPGWYVMVRNHDVITWLEENGIDYHRPYRSNRNILMFDDRDTVINLKMRWM